MRWSSRVGDGQALRPGPSPTRTPRPWTQLIAEKAKSYIRYWQSGGEQAAHGVFPLVLWIGPHGHRVAQLSDALAGLPAEHRQLFAVTTAERAAHQLIAGSFAGLTTKEVT